MAESRTVSTRKIEIVPGSTESAEIVFFDGAAGVQIGPAVSRVHFYHVVTTGEVSDKEVRKVTMSLAIPTAALVELCVNTIGAVGVNADGLRTAITTQTDLMFAAATGTHPV